MNTSTIKLSDHPHISFNESDFVKIENYTLQSNDYKYGDIELIEALTWWQERGLSYTVSGYGSKIPTHYKVKLNNKFYRVYCHVSSNVGAYYILIKNQRVYLC